MRALIFDTETTGMVQWKRPHTDGAQPDLIQLALIFVETDNWRTIARFCSLVALREGAKIDPAAYEAHGISEEDCAHYGIQSIVACSLFNQFCMKADLLVAHNMSFDESIMKTALYRLGDKPNRMEGKPLYCTKELTTNSLKLPGKYDSYKWPTLAEAYTYYTGEALKGAHDALVDSEACLTIFRNLCESGVVQLEA